MCARYTLTVPERLRELFPRVRFSALLPRFNIAPSTPVLGLRNAAGDIAELMIWGPRHINARVETLAEKPTFAEALRFRRAIVFADGYYEWHASPGTLKQPYRVTRRGGAPFAFAALWEKLLVPVVETAYACTLVTMPPRDDLAWLHDRTPLMLDAAGSDAWLRDGSIVPLADALEATPVSRAVNKVTRDDAALIEPVTPPIQDSLF